MEANGTDYYVARRRQLHENRLVESLEPATAPAWLVPIWTAPPGEEADRIVLYRFAPGS